MDIIHQNTPAHQSQYHESYTWAMKAVQLLVPNNPPKVMMTMMIMIMMMMTMVMIMIIMVIKMMMMIGSFLCDNFHDT